MKHVDFCRRLSVGVGFFFLYQMWLTGCIPADSLKRTNSAPSFRVSPTSNEPGVITPTPSPIPSLLPTDLGSESEERAATEMPLPTITPESIPQGLQVLAALEGTSGPVYSLAWSPDGTTIASAAHSQVNIWDASFLALSASLEGHTSYVWGVDWSPDGQRLSTTSQYRTRRLWEIENRIALATLGDVWAFCVSWSPGDRQLASGNSRGVLQLWDIETGELQSEIRSSGFTSEIISIA